MTDKWGNIWQILYMIQYNTINNKEPYKIIYNDSAFEFSI